jgi:hypothetical protein
LASRAEARCPLCEQTGEAIELIFGNEVFAGAGALDSIGRRAQHHSCTNELSGGGCRNDRDRLNHVCDASLSFKPSDSLTLA